MNEGMNEVRARQEIADRMVRASQQRLIARSRAARRRRAGTTLQ